MTNDQDPTAASADEAAAAGGGARRPPTPTAARALAEAAARRADRERQRNHPAKEVNGRGGLDPTRYGDWEINGLTSDF